jgi:hypothetical protein
MASAHTGSLAAFYAADPNATARLVPAVEAWRADLRASVAPALARQLEWDEHSAVTASWSLGVSGWLALRCFAFYAERSDLELPDTVPPLLEFDAAYRAAAEAKFPRSLYGQILACRVWLPGDFPATLRVPLPDGETAEVGSTAVLADQLRWLNQRTFGADAELVAAWAQLPAAAGGPLLDAARVGFAGLSAAVALAQRERLPVLVREG